jgi:hypothetical protein
MEGKNSATVVLVLDNTLPQAAQQTDLPTSSDAGGGYQQTNKHRS